MERVWTIGGWTLLAIAVGMLVCAVFWDRARGRSRCPKCWYDMTGSTGLRCPECGCEARSERFLHRTRRNWKLALSAIPFLAGGYTLHHWSAIQRGAWPELVPTTALILLAERDDPLKPTLNYPIPGPAPSAGAKMKCELWGRIKSARAWQWQSQFFIDRCLRASETNGKDWLYGPVRWYMERPIPVTPGWSSIGTFDVIGGLKVAQDRWTIPGCKPGETPWADVEFKVGDRVVCVRRVTISTVVMTDPFESMRPDRSPQTAKLVQRVLDPRLIEDGRSIGIGGAIPHDDPFWTDTWPKIGVGFDVEVRLADQVVATGIGWFPAGSRWDRFPISWAPGKREAVIASPGMATFHFRGTVDSPRHEFEHWQFSGPWQTWWAGEFECPVRVESQAETWRR